MPVLTQIFLVQDICKVNEVFSKCDNHGCQNTCTELDLITRCHYKPGCYPGCICKPGFLRDPSGKCICETLCIKCPRNEVYSKCGNNGCQNTCAKPNIAQVCSAICRPGCICAKGYLRNSKGVCVIPEKCYTCKTNEVFSKCDNHGCQNTCAEPDLITRCDYVPGCYPGCICKPGFLRDPSGKCIYETLCKCEENEQYSNSGISICANTCEDPRKSTKCKAKAVPGCGCKVGYLRNKDGCCVLPEDCGGCGGDPNAQFSGCGDPCPATCSNPNGPRCELCFVEGGCTCKEGYVKNNHRKCILASDCHKFQCSGNQTYNACPRRCPPEQTCEDYINGVIYFCPVDIKCVPRCECQNGLIRQKVNGICVLPETCCDDPNSEVVECPNPCPGGTCVSPEFAPCKVACKRRGCQCKSGYVKDSNGKCIQLSTCPIITKPCLTTIHPACDDPNAELVNCPNPCPGGTCELPEFLPCPRPFCPIHVQGCQCKTGYVKDVNGKCILLSQCPNTTASSTTIPTSTPIPISTYPACMDPNAELVLCPNPCPGGTCEQPYFLLCPRPYCRNQIGCQCKAGYVKDANGNCILLSECPSSTVSSTTTPTSTLIPTSIHPGCDDPNAELVNCPNPCPGGTCVEPEFSPCPRPLCINQLGCQCKAGYVKDANENCILLSQCPTTSTSVSPPKSTPTQKYFPECEDPNAELVFCPNLCPGGTCEQPEFSLCPQRTCFGSKDIGCQCKEGYVKYINGKCIPISQCNGTCNENEVYNPCTDFCSFDQDCYSLLEGVFPVCSSPFPDIPCSSRCECRQGFVRLGNGSCVLPDACCDDPFAEVVDCPLPCNETCPGVESSCPEYCAVRGCRCKPGLVKNEQNKCVYTNECAYVTTTTTEYVSDTPQASSQIPLPIPPFHK